MMDDESQKSVNSSIESASPPPQMRLSVRNNSKNPEQQQFEDRTQAQIQSLKDQTEKINFFKQMYEEDAEDGERKHLNCCREMRYEFAPAGSIVFTQGAIGDQFFIIIKGQLAVYTVNEKIVDQSKKSMVAKHEKNMDSVTSAHYSMVNQYLAERRQSVQKFEIQLNQEKELNTGASFGELALLKKQPRQATIVSLEDCHLATLDKKQFDNILKQSQMEKTFNEKRFLETLHIFSGWVPALIQRLLLNATLIQTSFDERIFTENDHSDDVYIIKEGSYMLFELIPFDIFGFQNVMKKSNRLYTIICKVPGVILKINREQFLNKILKTESSEPKLLQLLQIRLKQIKYRYAQVSSFFVDSKTKFLARTEDFGNFLVEKSKIASSDHLLNPIKLNHPRCNQDKQKPKITNANQTAYATFTFNDEGISNEYIQKFHLESRNIRQSIKLFQYASSNYLDSIKPAFSIREQSQSEFKSQPLISTQFQSHVKYQHQVPDQSNLEGMFSTKSTTAHMGFYKPEKDEIYGVPNQENIRPALSHSVSNLQIDVNLSASASASNLNSKMKQKPDKTLIKTLLHQFVQDQFQTNSTMEADDQPDTCWSNLQTEQSELSKEGTTPSNKLRNALRFSSSRQDLKGIYSPLLFRRVQQKPTYQFEDQFNGSSSYHFIDKDYTIQNYYLPHTQI